MVRRTFLLSAASGMVLAAGMAHAGVTTRIAILTGGQETPPVATGAFGAARFRIDTDTNTVNYRIVFSGLGTAEVAAHVHGIAAPGAAAGVLFPLPLGTIKTGSFVYAEAQEAALLGGGMYVNVHSVAFGGGEIRGQIVTHVALLDGGQETPPVPGAGVGLGLFNIDTSADTLSYYIVFSGLGSAEVAAHIHGTANYGAAAGVLFPLPAGSPKIGSWAYPAALEGAILDGLTYANIHTVGFGGGEIRGQIVSSVSPMDGGQEVPPVPTGGAGFAMAALDRAAGVLGFDTRHQGLTSAEIAAHIHGFAPAGAAAGVLMPLPAGGRKMGTWPFGLPSLANVTNELSYVNVHSMLFGGGEIRAQITFPCTVRVVSGPSPTSVNAGQNASLSITADGTGTLAYQWRKGGVAVSNGGNISGATSSTLSFTPATMADSGSYDCVVTNTCGPTASAAAALTVVCYPNCDGSTVAPILTVGDFGCFLNAFAAGDSYANCDGSTVAPVLTVADFGCFLNAFAAGCP